MRNLPQNQKDSLEHCTVYETLLVQMASGTTLRFAVGEVTLNDGIYLGKLTVTSPLRMSLTKAADNVSLEIDNTTLELGQALISQPYAMDGSFAVFGAYFKNNETGEEWHTKKIPGEIRIVRIDGSKIICTFLSDLDAAKAEGRLVSEVFPNAQIQREVVIPVDDRITSVDDTRSSIIDRKLSVLYDNMEYGRYNLPDFYID